MENIAPPGVTVVKKERNQSAWEFKRPPVRVRSRSRSPKFELDGLTNVNSDKDEDSNEGNGNMNLLEAMREDPPPSAPVPVRKRVRNPESRGSGSQSAAEGGDLGSKRPCRPSASPEMMSDHSLKDLMRPERAPTGETNFAQRIEDLKSENLNTHRHAVKMENEKNCYRMQLSKANEAVNQYKIVSSSRKQRLIELEAISEKRKERITALEDENVKLSESLKQAQRQLRSPNGSVDSGNTEPSTSIERNSSEERSSGEEGGKARSEKRVSFNVGPDDRAQIIKDRDRYRSQVESLQSMLDKKNTQIANISRQLTRYQHETNKLKVTDEQIESMKTQIHSATLTIQRLEETSKREKREHAQMERQVADLTGKMTRERQGSDKMHARLESSRNAIKQMETQIQELTRYLHDRDHTIARLSKRRVDSPVKRRALDGRRADENQPGRRPSRWGGKHQPSQTALPHRPSPRGGDRPSVPLPRSHSSSEIHPTGSLNPPIDRRSQSDLSCSIPIPASSPREIAVSPPTNHSKPPDDSSQIPGVPPDHLPEHSLVSQEEEEEEEEYYVVEKIENHKTTAEGTVEFLIKWEGCPSEENTWEPEENVADKDLIRDYFSSVDKRSRA
eukprot:82881_1